MNLNIFVILGILIFVPIHQLNIKKKIIIYLLLLILFLKNNEGFGNIDAEALQNMASLYNSSTGILKVNNIEASGNITAAGYGEFGNAYIGKWKTTDSKWATFSHKDHKEGGGDFALQQNALGRTVVNSVTNQPVQIRTNDNGVKEVTLKDGNVTATGNITATGYGEFGNAYIGKFKTTDSTWATFSHKDNKEGAGDYALQQNSEGQTIINSKTGQIVKVSTNDNGGSGDIHAKYLTLSGTCSRSSGPIKLKNSNCNHDDHTDNLAIGGEAHVEVFVDS